MTGGAVGGKRRRVEGLPTIPDSASSKQEEPTRPGCAVKFSYLLDKKNDLPSQEALEGKCQELAQSTPHTKAEQNESCYDCLKSWNLGLLRDAEECPAMDAVKALKAILRLKEPANRAYLQRIRHILDNPNRTPRIGGLDDETGKVLRGEDIEEEGENPEDKKDTSVKDISPQGWPDAGRGVDPEVLSDLGY